MKILDFFDYYFFRPLVNLAYPQYYRPIQGYMKFYQVFKRYFFFQKVLRVNGSVPWPVDFRSKVIGWEFIQKGILCDPGDSPGVYINAFGGLRIGDNVEIAANSVIVTTNHDKYDQRKVRGAQGVTIGNNVWIGANCVILPGSTIGNEVTIGAGCVVSGVIPSKSTVTLGLGSFIVRPKSMDYQWDIYKENLNRSYHPTYASKCIKPAKLNL